jgi:bifunctional DNA-binding transcriptional regulator/antitoxin component of YhaV-PrlF toxin-antitoxin module
MAADQITTVSDTFSIELPREVVDHLKIGSGDKLRLVETPTGIELQRVDQAVAEQLAAFDQVMLEDDQALRRLAE